MLSHPCQQRLALGQTLQPPLGHTSSHHFIIPHCTLYSAPKASMNLGLSHELKENFPSVVSIARPEYTFKPFVMDF